MSDDMTNQQAEDEAKRKQAEDAERIEQARVEASKKARADAEEKAKQAEAEAKQGAESKPSDAPAGQDARSYRTPPVFTTAAELLDIQQAEGLPTPGRSYSPGLEDVPDSQVPGLGNGGMISHVRGPQQAAVDPIAAGLDTEYKPKSRNELRATTQTGIDAAGPRPSTYAEKPDGDMVKQAADNTHELVASKSDQEAAAAPGPNS